MYIWGRKNTLGERGRGKQNGLNNLLYITYCIYYLKICQATLPGLQSICRATHVLSRTQIVALWCSVFFSTYISILYGKSSQPGVTKTLAKARSVVLNSSSQYAGEQQWYPVTSGPTKGCSASPLQFKVPFATILHIPGWFYADAN